MAAQQAFSGIGYARAGIREIAAIAGTSSTMLIRYFGSKAGLYEAALIEALAAGDLWSQPRECFGRFLADQFQRRDVQILPPAMMALAAGDAEAARITARIAEVHAIAPMATWLGGDDARHRAISIFMLATSFVLNSRNVPLLTAADETAMGQWLAETIQRIVDGTHGELASQAIGIVTSVTSTAMRSPRSIGERSA